MLSNSTPSQSFSTVEDCAIVSIFFFVGNLCVAMCTANNLLTSSFSADDHLFWARFAGNETYRNTVNTPIYNIDNFSQDSGPRRNTCHLDQDFYMNPRVSRPRLQTRGYITNAMQCNKSLIKVLKLFLIFQFSTKDYLAKTQVYTSVFETFTQYCNNHSVQLVTSMHSEFQTTYHL